MHEAIESPKGNRFVTASRWLAVLPAAFVASRLVSGLVFALMTSIGIDLRGPDYPAFLFPLLQLLPNGFAFTAVGALVAPTRRSTTATTLAVLYALMSHLIHIVLPSNPGLTNYMHFTGASLGAVIGIAVVFRFTQKQGDCGDEK